VRYFFQLTALNGLLCCGPRRAAQAKAFAPFQDSAAFIVRRACVTSFQLTALNGLLYCGPRRAAQAEAFAPFPDSAALIVRQARVTFFN
jgi:hypothetical protein